MIDNTLLCCQLYPGERWKCPLISDFSEPFNFLDPNINFSTKAGKDDKIFVSRYSYFCAIYRTIETTKYNNDMENYAVCRGNQHCRYYRLKNRQTQHSPGVGYPSSCNTRQAEHVSAAADTRRPEKTSQDWRRKSG